MFGTKRSCPGTSTNAMRGPPGSPPGRPVHPGEPEVDGEAAAPFFLPPVRFHPGQRPHQRRLAVVDVPGRRDDLGDGHVLVPAAPGSAAVTAAAMTTARVSVSSSAGATARRSSSSRPSSTRPMTAGTRPWRTAGPVRSGAGQGVRHAHRGAGQRHAGRSATADRPLRPYRVGVDLRTNQVRHDLFDPINNENVIGGERLHDRYRRTGQGGFERGQRQLVDPQGPGQRVPRQPFDQRRPARAAGRPAGRRAACRRSR